MDEEVILKTIDALDHLKILIKETQRKEDKRIWKNIHSPLSLNDGLNQLTKNELDDIRKHLNIRNVSQLKKS